MALAGALTACLSGNIVEPGFKNPVAGKSVLFIGNSLTYYSDLPVLVQGIADAAGGDSLIISMVAGPDMPLVDHWNLGDARRLGRRSIAARTSRGPPSRTDWLLWT